MGKYNKNKKYEGYEAYILSDNSDYNIFNFNIEEKSENEDDYEKNIPASFLLKKYDNNIRLLVEY